MGASHLVTAWAADWVLPRRTRGAALAWLGRPFSRRARLRLAIHADMNAITFAQVAPFLAEAEGLWRSHGVDVRLFDISRLLGGEAPCPADVVLIAPWFRLEPAQLERALDRLAGLGAEISFLDSFAHNDLRLAPFLADRIRFYFKKSLFRDRSVFAQGHYGAQVVDFYVRLYGIEQPVVRHDLPPGFLDRLRLSPGFFMAPGLRRQFGQPLAGLEGRIHDMQVRIETRGTPWYHAMRQDALARALALPDLRLTPRERVGKRLYDRELRQSRLCFSPFGYGELCWRDIEAFAAGTVLVKPDMGHLETLPDIFEAGVTYLPVKWDFSDLAEVVAQAMRDPDLCRSLAQAGHARIATYLQEQRFVTDMAPLFA